MKYRKDQLRRQALARRDAMSAAERCVISQALVTCADTLCPEEETVSAFWPLRSEIDPRPLMSALAERGNRLALPAVVRKNTMIFRLFKGIDRLIDMPFALKGPADDAAVVDPEMILLPLAAFDNRGNRVGYGAGHYDRAVAGMHDRGLRPRLVGLAFDCQRVESVPAELHDVPLQAILTESGFRTFR